MNLNRKVALLLLEIFGVVLAGCGLVTTLSFVVAKTPQEAVLAGGPQMPSSWEVGVLNHGSYYEWYSISQHPFLFVLSVAGLISGFAIIGYIRRTPR